MESQNPLMTRQELAARWGVNAKTIDRMRADGCLPWLNLAARGEKRPTVRFRLLDVEAFEADRRRDRAAVGG